MNRNYILMAAILLIGLSIRTLVVYNTKDTAQSGYSTLMKVNLNYDWAKDHLKEYSEKWQSGKMLHDSLFQLRGGQFDPINLRKNLLRSNHPPLYYYLIHGLTACTQFIQPTILKGLVFNIAVSFFIMIVLFKAGSSFTHSSNYGLLAMGLWGFGLVALSGTVLQKAYELQTLLVLLQFYFFIDQAGKERLIRRDYLFFYFACVASLLTHYYSYFFTLLLSFFIGLHYVFINRDWQKLKRYTLVTLGAVITSFIIYPNAVKDMLHDTRAEQIQDKLDDTDSMEFILTDGWQVFIEILSKPLLLFLGFLVLATIISLIARKMALKDVLRHFNYKFLYTILYSVSAVLIIHKISPYSTIRYILPVIPIFLLSMSFIPRLVSKWDKISIVVMLLITLGVTCSNLKSALNREVDSELTIQSWVIDNPMSKLGVNEPICILTYKTGERIRAMLFHLASHEVALTLNTINVELLNQRPNAVVLIDPKIEIKKRQKGEEVLKQRGYNYIGKVRNFDAFRIQNGD